MVNSSTVNTCPLFPDELENNRLNKSYGSLNPNTGQLNIPGLFSVQENAILPPGVNVGSAATTYNVSYDAWQSTANRNYELDLHEKYPALRQAWEHYQNILGMCKSREEETSENRL